MHQYKDLRDPGTFPGLRVRVGRTRQDIPYRYSAWAFLAWLHAAS